jgi:hypothetical protein
MIFEDGVPMRKVAGEDIVEAFAKETDLTNMHGDAYREYQRKVSMLIPLPRKK